jgi:uncharacterized protein (TIGR00369 family)
MRRQHHPACVVCGHHAGLGADYRLAADGSIEATFDCSAALQGYPDRVHGGIITSLIDGAMTNCLFAYGVAAVTAELKVRFRQPTQLDRAATVRARLASRFPPLYRLTAEVVQDGSAVVTAEGAFVDLAALDGLPGQLPLA